MNFSPQSTIRTPQSMVLIHPPVVKPCEPPPGIAKLCGALNHHGVEFRAIDTNLEGLLSLLGSPLTAPDTWTRRALRHLSNHLSLLRSREGYEDLDRYTRAIKDINRVLEKAAGSSGARVSLGNYEHSNLSPTRSYDLISAAESPESNPFYLHFRKRLLEVMEKDQPSVVGFSLNYLSQALTTFAMAGFLKRIIPRLTLVLGGGLVTSWMRRPGWDNPFVGLVDHLVAGPGELSLLTLMGIPVPLPLERLCRKSVHGSTGSPRTDNETIKINELAVRPEPFDSPFVLRSSKDERRLRAGSVEGRTANCDTASEGGGRGGGEQYTPDYSSFPTKDYFAPGPILPYSASTGCYWNKCSFCPEEAEGNEYIPIPVGRVIEELRFLVEKHRPVLIHLTDNTVSPALLKALSKDPPGAPWYGFVRFTRHLTDPDFCIALKKSGCVMLKLGLESGDQGVLDAMQKGINLEEASAALRAIKKAEIATYIYLLFGTPPESLSEARKTLDFVARHREQIDFLNLAVFNLPIYGPDTESLQTRIFYEGDLSLYVDFDHPRGWSRKAVRQFLDKEFKRHPAIAPILRRDPPVFTSNHAPLFVIA